MFRYSFSNVISNVIVVGCGGTGSRAIPIVTQLLCSNEFTKNIKITLIDGDIVENKNTKRQLFLSSEVGKNKAQVLADRYRKGFGANIDAVPMFIPSCEELNAVMTGGMSSPETKQFYAAFMDSYLSIIKKDNTTLSERPLNMDTFSYIQSLMYTHLSRKTSTVIISCVDSPDARRRLLQLIPTMCSKYHNNMSVIPDYLSNFVVIDAGNEDAFGQVSYFNPVIPSLCNSPEVLECLPERSPCSVDIAFVPMPIGKYKNMKEGVREGSCADLDQTLAINQMMATFIGMIFQNLLYGMKMDFHTLRANLNGTFSSDKMSLGWMKGVVTDNEDYLYGAIQGVTFSNTADSEESHKKFLYSEPSIKYSIAHKKQGATQGRSQEEYNYSSAFTETVDLKGLSVGIAPMDVFYKTHLFLSNWRDIVIPTILENVLSGFTTMTEGFKRYVVKASTRPHVDTLYLIPAIGSTRDSMLAANAVPYNVCSDVIKGNMLEDLLPVMSKLGHRGYLLPKSKDKLLVGKPTKYLNRNSYGGGSNSFSMDVIPSVVSTRILAERILVEEGLDKFLAYYDSKESGFISVTDKSNKGEWLVNTPCFDDSNYDTSFLRGTPTFIVTKDLAFAQGDANSMDHCKPKLLHASGRIALTKEAAAEAEKATEELRSIISVQVEVAAKKPVKAKKA